eukprot:323992-Pelagomonas_calceolata.AAC.1
MSHFYGHIQVDILCTMQEMFMGKEEEELPDAAIPFQEKSNMLAKVPIARLDGAFLLALCRFH